MKPLLIATTNQSKFSEFKKLIPKKKFQLISIKGLPETKNLQVTESGSTFKQNAILKAKAFSHASGLLTLSEDSGLVVTSLNGKPGVLSARFGPNSKARNLKIIRQLKNNSNRSASYKAVIAICNPQGKLLATFSGTTSGRILKKPLGKRGFGYDPIFFSTKLNQSLGMASEAAKNSISHRGQALKKALKFIESSTL